MRKLIAAALFVGLSTVAALAQSQQAPTLRIVSEDGNRLPSDLMYGNTKVKPMRLRPGTNTPITIDDSDFFVQQQYVDFLSRFPDQSGFSFSQKGRSPDSMERWVRLYLTWLETISDLGSASLAFDVCATEKLLTPM